MALKEKVKCCITWINKGVMLKSLGRKKLKKLIGRRKKKRNQSIDLYLTLIKVKRNSHYRGRNEQVLSSTFGKDFSVVNASKCSSQVCDTDVHEQARDPKQRQCLLIFQLYNAK